MNPHTTSTLHELKSKRGGKRTGAGRPKGSGSFKEPTKSIRIPLSLFDDVQRMRDHCGSTSLIQPTKESSKKTLPLFSGTVHAGFLSPADDHIEATLNLHDYVIRHEQSSFFLRVEGDSMEGASIHNGDLLVVDRSIPPKNGDIVIVVVHGELAVKRLSVHNNSVMLCAENPAYAPITIQGDQEIHIWGVVTFVVHKIRTSS